MIEVSDSLMAEIENDYARMNVLFRFDFNGNIQRITDAASKIETPITIDYNNGNPVFRSDDNGNPIIETFISSSSEIISLAIPEQKSTLGRDTHQITMYDQDGVWRNRFHTVGYNRVGFDLFIIFLKGDGNYTETLQIYNGRCVNIESNSGMEEPEQIIITFAGQLEQIDKEKSAVTTDSDQRLRDVDDSCFKFTGLLRDFIWGGDDDVIYENSAPRVIGSRYFNAPKYPVGSGYLGITYTYTFSPIDLDNVFSGNSLIFSIVNDNNNAFSLNGSILTIPTITATVIFNGLYYFYRSIISVQIEASNDNGSVISWLTFSLHNAVYA